MKQNIKKIYILFISLILSLCPLKVSASGIILNKSQTTIAIGYSENLTYTITDGLSSSDIIWTSTDTSVASVENGKVIALKEGTAIITASLDGTRSTCKVTVIDIIPLNNITLNKSSITLQEKQTETLSVSYTPANASNKNVTWRSSNVSIVTVDNQGKITAIKPGSATITVISEEGRYVSYCKVIVESLSKKVTSVTLNKKEISIIAGETATITATVNPSYAENKKISWSSSNEKIATIDNGKITAISPGTTEIKVITEDGNKEAICKVTVKSKPIKSISFDQSEQTVYIGSNTTLNTISEPENTAIENPIWKSSNEAVATVENGVVTANALGETTITISNEDQSITASTKIIVVNKPKEKLKITVEGYKLNFDPDVKNYSLKIGNEKQLVINTNISKDKVKINGNQKLKNGSIITITVTDEEKTTYVINIKKNENYTIYIIAIISVLLLLNLIRIIIKNKKKS